MERIRFLSSQDVNVMKPARLSSEDPVNTFWIKLSDHFMMLYACWSRLSRTNRLSMVEETQKSKWLYVVKN